MWRIANKEIVFLAGRGEENISFFLLSDLGSLNISPRQGNTLSEPHGHAG